MEVCLNPVTSPPSSSSIYHLDTCKTLTHLKQTHAHLIKTTTSINGFNPSSSLNLNLTTKLITTYGRLGDTHSAQSAFHHFPSSNHDTHIYNALIQSYLINTNPLSALQLHALMHRRSVPPNEFTFPPLLKAAAAVTVYGHGFQLHCKVIKLGFSGNRFSGVGLIDMYMKQGCIEDARQVFDEMPERDVVAAWNAILSGYVQNGQPELGLEVFKTMVLSGVGLDFIAAACALGACGQVREMKMGEVIQGLVVKSGIWGDTVVSTALVEMYASCEEVECSRKLFDEMPEKDLVAWNSMVSCFAQNGHVDDSMEMFKEMQRIGLKPNKLTMVALLPALARLGSLRMAKGAHGYLLRKSFDTDEFVTTALLDVYAKSGNLQAAEFLFNGTSKKSVVAWTAMIAGYGMHGRGDEALCLYEQMLCNSIKPNDVTYVGVLSACSHAGLFNEGKEYFRRMVEEHGITPRAQHYACMVDLLGRSGKLTEAKEMIIKMPMPPSLGVWGALLSACKIHGDVELAEYAAARLFEMNCDDPGFYTLLSNIYAEAGMWEKVNTVRQMINERGLRKIPGWSCIEIENQTHGFVAGDRSHPDSSLIYMKLRELRIDFKRGGYKPQVKAVVEEEDVVKEKLVWNHSERMAIAYGLIRTTPGTTLRIMKNLRICEDCHEVSKFVSKLKGREIIIRDIVRFHHVKDGICSCGNFW